MNKGNSIEEIIAPMSSDLSVGGRRRLENLSRLITSVCGQNSAVFSAQNEIMGVIVGFVHGLEANPMKIELASCRVSCDEDKKTLMKEIDDKMDMKSYDTVFMSFEAWMSTPAIGEKPMRPSADPNRKEIVCTNFIVNINFEPYIITAQQPIIRDGGYTGLDDPSFSICNCTESAGMMVPSFSKTCPIT